MMTTEETILGLVDILSRMKQTPNYWGERGAVIESALELLRTHALPPDHPLAVE